MKVRDIWRRQGKILIDSEILKGMSLDLMEKIMSNLIVLRCEHLAHNNKFEIRAISREFDELERGLEIPEYIVEIEKQVEDGYKIEFKSRDVDDLTSSGVGRDILKYFWEHELKKCETEKEIDNLCEEYGLMITEAKPLNMKSSFAPAPSPFGERRFVPKPEVSYHIESKPENDINFETYVNITCGGC